MSILMTLKKEQKMNGVNQKVNDPYILERNIQSQEYTSRRLRKWK